MPYTEYQILFGGGLNNKDQDFAIQDNQATALQNVVFTGEGSIKTRDGYAQYGSTVAGSKKCVAMGQYAYSDGSGTITRSAYAVFGTDIYKYITGTWTAQSRTLTDSLDGNFVQANNELYYFNGQEDCQNLANTTWSTLSGLGAPLSGVTTVGRYAVYKGGMLFVAGMDATPSRVYVSGDSTSSLDTPEDFSGGWAYDVGTNDNSGIITGLAILGNYVVVLKQFGIYLLYGNTGGTQSLIQKVDKVGCIAPKSIASDGRCIYFQSADGHVYAFDGAQIYKISEVISGTIEDGLNTSYYDDSAGVYDSVNDYYILSCVKAAASVPAYQLVFDIRDSIIQSGDYRKRVWTIFDGPPANVWLEYTSTAGTIPTLLFGDSGGTGKIFTMFSGTNDDGTAINSYYDTKSFDVGAPQWEKRFKYLYTDTRQVGSWDLNVKYSINKDAFTWTTPGQIDLSYEGAILPVTLPVTLAEGTMVSYNMVIIPDKGRYIKIRWQVNFLNQYFEIYQASLYFILTKKRKRYASFAT